MASPFQSKRETVEWIDEELATEEQKNTAFAVMEVKIGQNIKRTYLVIKKTRE